MTELRQKMIRAMELENLSDNTPRRFWTPLAGLPNTTIDLLSVYIKNRKTDSHPSV